MTHWENIWSFNTAQFRVDFDVAEDCDLDLSWDDDGSTREGLESGKYVAFQARVAVLDNDGDIIGTDYLGNCIYESAQEFCTSHRDPNPLNRNCTIMRAAHGNCVICHYFPDMVRIAIKEARKNLCTPRPYIRCSALTQALRAILYESLTLAHNDMLDPLPAEQVAKNYKQWRIKAAHVLEATRGRE